MSRPLRPTRQASAWDYLLASQTSDALDPVADAVLSLGAAAVVMLGFGAVLIFILLPEGSIGLVPVLVLVLVLILLFSVAPLRTLLGRSARYTAPHRRKRTRILADLRSPQPSEAVAELQLRCGYWASELSRPEMPHAQALRPSLDAPWAVTRHFLQATACATGFLIIVHPVFAQYTVVILGAGVLAYLFIDERRKGRVLTRLISAAQGRSCPDCSYDLACLCCPDSPSSLTGPRRCPECGSPWPLIPPPVPPSLGLDEWGRNIVPESAPRSCPQDAGAGR